MSEIPSVEIPTFTIHVKKFDFNSKLDFRNKDASVNIELSHVKAEQLIKALEQALKEHRGAIRFKLSGTRGDF